MQYATATIDTATIQDIERQWGTRPRLVLACAGYSDQHWQIWHPTHNSAPAYVVGSDGILVRHPDSPIA